MTKLTPKPVTPVSKPYLTGSAADSRTVKAAFGFFGILVLTVFMCFLVSSMMNLNNDTLRVILNSAVVLLALFILFNTASGSGADAVARGEILYQKQEAGKPFAASERAMCYHPLKGFLIGFLGTLPLLICAILLAVTAEKQVTGIGSLPDWLKNYQRRSEIGDALVAYTAQRGIGLTDIVRMIVRAALLPFVTMVGTENSGLMLLLERVSPLLTLLPAAAYGIGYMQGKSIRTRVHTGIAEDQKKRARKERKERKKRIAAGPKGPEQLN